MVAQAKTKRKAPAAKAAKSRGGAKRSSPKATAAKRKASSAGKASKVAAAAKAAGATGPNGSDAQRALRNMAVLARLKAGADPNEVAKEFEISARSVRAIREKREAQPSLLDAQPMGILEEMADDFQDAIAEFSAMAYAHADSNPAVSIAALKGKLVARRELADLMSDVGKLPSNLELFRAEGVLRRIADEMREMMGRLRREEVTMDEVEAFFGDITTRPEHEARAQIGAGE